MKHERVSGRLSTDINLASDSFTHPMISICAHPFMHFANVQHTTTIYSVHKPLSAVLYIVPVDNDAQSKRLFRHQQVKHTE